VLGGRRVPPLLAVIPAGLASVVLTVLTVLTVAGAAGWSRELHVAGSPTGAAAGLMTTAWPACKASRNRPAVALSEDDMGAALPHAGIA
jgi:hypothetical protein